MQIDIPQIDPLLWLRFTLEAKHRGIHVSELLNDAMRQFLGMHQPQFIQKEEEDKAFEKLAGTWSHEEAEEFEKNTEQFSQIDSDMWR
jgi:hypothetical protein